MPLTPPSAAYHESRRLSISRLHRQAYHGTKCPYHACIGKHITKAGGFQYHAYVVSISRHEVSISRRHRRHITKAKGFQYHAYEVSISRHEVSISRRRQRHITKAKGFPYHAYEVSISRHEVSISRLHRQAYHESRRLSISRLRSKHILPLLFFFL